MKSREQKQKELEASRAELEKSPCTFSLPATKR